MALLNYIAIVVNNFGIDKVPLKPLPTIPLLFIHCEKTTEIVKNMRQKIATYRLIILFKINLNVLVIFLQLTIEKLILFELIVHETIPEVIFQSFLQWVNELCTN